MRGISSAVLTIGMGFASAAFGDALTFDSTAGDVGSSSHTYVLGGVSVMASGFNGGDLYSKYSGSDEDGLGLARDPSGDHEIFPATAGAPTPFIQVNLTNLIKAGFSNFQFMMSSVQGKEAWQVSACPTAGTLCTNAQTLTGNNQTLDAVPANLSAADPFLDVRLAPGVSGGVLLAEIAATSSTSRSSVPEPATLGLLGLGLAGIGFAGRRRKT